MAKKVLKTRRQISSSLRNDIYDELQSYSQKTDIPISKLLDRALLLFFKENNVNIDDQES